MANVRLKLMTYLRVDVLYLADDHYILSVSIWSYSVQMRENADQNNAEYGHFHAVDKMFLQSWSTRSDDHEAYKPLC